MKTTLVAVLALALAAPVWAQAQAPSASPAPAASPAAWKAGEPPPDMMTYYFVMLVKGPNWTGQSNPDLMKQHLGADARLERPNTEEGSRTPSVVGEGV